METNENGTSALRERGWRWPREPDLLQTLQDRAMAQAEFRALGLPAGVVDNEALRQAAIDAPDDDAPRQRYAEWMAAQDHEFARLLGAFVEAQLRVARAYRANRRADVSALRTWRTGAGYVSTAAFRSGDVLRPWFLDPLSSLVSMGLVGWPQVYRGFVERVGMRAVRFLEVAEELYRLAPIRHLVLVGVSEVATELAACPHLARIHSISLPRYRVEDELTEEALRELISSPHLANLKHLRIVQQHRIKAHGYEAVLTAPTLPRLSSLEIFAPRFDEDVLGFDPRGRTERMVTYDSAIPMMRPREGIVQLERGLGYVPCLHPEDYYGREFVDLEAVVESPIAEDACVRTHHGRSHGGVRRDHSGLR